MVKNTAPDDMKNDPAASMKYARKPDSVDVYEIMKFVFLQFILT